MGPETQAFLQNCWYVAAWDHELADGKLLSRTILEQATEPGGGGVEPAVPGEHVLGVGVRAVLAHQREDGGQIGDPRRARNHARPRTGS